MIYECEKCNTALPAGVLACPECGEEFEQSVPQDADVPKRGWQPKAQKNDAPSPAADAAAADDSSSQASSPGISEPYPDYILPEKPNVDLLRPTLVLLNKWKVPLLIGLLFVTVVAIIAHAGHTTDANPLNPLAASHPLYPSNVTRLIEEADRHGDVVVWPYEGHDDSIGVTYRPGFLNGAYIGVPTKDDLNTVAENYREEFSTARKLSGFTPTEAIQCQVYVSTDRSSGTAFDGPGIDTKRDRFIEILVQNQ